MKETNGNGKLGGQDKDASAREASKVLGKKIKDDAWT